MTQANEIEPLFTSTTGEYRFARWGRAIVPIVFGVEDQTLGVIKGAVEAVVALAGHNMAETDPELGANLMMFFFRDWDELLEVPNLDKLVDGLAPLVVRLKSQNASQYRGFRFDDDGAMQAAFCFVRMDAAMADLPADVLSLTQAVQVILLWSDRAFADKSPLAVADGTTVLRPDIAGVIRAAYDPVMPAVAQDASHALRLAARLAISG